MRPRKNNGLRGRRMPAAHKRAISKGQQRRHQRAREQQLDLDEWSKRCTRCNRRGLVRMDGEGDFRIVYRRLASGERRPYPSSECKQCNNARAAAHREKLRAAGKLKEKQNEWNSRRDPEKRREYQRDYGRMRRALEGATPRGPWKRYRDMPQWRVTSASFFPFWMRIHEILRAEGVTKAHDWLGISEVEYVSLTRVMRGWTQGEKDRDTVPAAIAERVLLSADLDHRRDELVVVKGRMRHESKGSKRRPPPITTIEGYRARRAAKRREKSDSQEACL